MSLFKKLFASSEHKTALLWEGIKSRDLEKTEYALTLGPDIEARDREQMTPLCHAVWLNEPRLVEALLKAGADKEAKNANGATPIHTAAEFAGKEVVDILLTSGANIHAKRPNGATALHDCCGTEGPIEVIVRTLLKAGADLEAKAEDGKTPLHMAAWLGYPKSVRVFLNAGAKKDAQDSRGWTPLHYAADEGEPEIVEALLKAGVNKEIKNRDGQTAIHRAAYSGCGWAGRVLLGSTEDGYIGNTPIKGRAQLVEALRAARAAKEANDPHGKFANASFCGVDEARKLRHAMVVDILLRAGANSATKDGNARTPIQLAGVGEPSDSLFPSWD